MAFEIEYKDTWLTPSLEDVVMFVIGGDWGKEPTIIDEDYVEVLCIRGSEIRDWSKNKGNTASIRAIKKSSLETRELIEGDILLEISGGGPDQPVGRTVLIDKQTLSFLSEKPKVCTNFLRLLRFPKAIDSSFINMFFDFFYASGEIVNYQGGSNNLRNLKFAEFSKIKIPLPPLNEQHRIVSKIEELFSELDNGVANLKLAQNQLKVYRQAILKYAFEGKLTEQWRQENNPESVEILLERINRERSIWLKEELKKKNSEAKRLENKLEKGKVELPKQEKIPDSWEWISFLKASHRVVDCHNKTAPYESVGIYLVRTTNVKNGKLDLKNKIQFVSQETYEYWSRRYFPQPNDILFTREAPMGEAAIIPPNTKICLGQRMMLIKVFPEFILPKFLLYNILNPSFQKRILDKAIGTGVKHLRVGDVENLVFPICSIAEQKTICSEIDSKFSVIDNLEETIIIGLQKSEALRQSILKKAFEGKLVPQDTNDEPASELLKRIKAEKKKYQEEQQKLKKKKNTQKYAKA